MREEQREEESISSYVASIEKSTTEDEIVETATKATSSSNIYSGFAELLSALEKKNSSKNEKIKFWALLGHLLIRITYVSAKNL